MAESLVLLHVMSGYDATCYSLTCLASIGLLEDNRLTDKNSVMRK